MAHNQKHDDVGPALDWVGLSLSGLCIAHCLLLPILGSALPTLAHGWPEAGIHMILAIVLIPLGLTAFVRGFKKHRNWQVVGGGALGLSLLINGLLSSSLGGHDEFSFFSTVAGSATLILAHFFNWRLSKCQKCITTDPMQAQKT